MIRRRLAGFAVAGLVGCTTTGPPEPVTDAPPREVILEQRVARAELQLLEKESHVEELQSRLEDARRDVVRAMAKLQTFATRAEAASVMAEAQVALQSLPRADGANRIEEPAQLMQLATAEFDKENYGGALYLANQAKAAVAAAKGQLSDAERGALRRGEVPFARPLRLRTTARANVRQGPGGAFAVVYQLAAGRALTGYSFADQWVRVADESGRRGWIHQRLITRRP